MRKRLFFINGNACVGKSTTCCQLRLELPNCVYLDGDWCLNLHPHIVNHEIYTQRFELCALILNHYIQMPIVENIVFCIAHGNQKLIDKFFSELNLDNVDLYNITLIVNEKAYIKRFQRAIKRGERPKYWDAVKFGEHVHEKYLDKNLANIHKYEQLDGIKIDTSVLSVHEVVEKIKQLSLQTEQQ